MRLNPNAGWIWQKKPKRNSNQFCSHKKGARLACSRQSFFFLFTSKTVRDTDLNTGNGFPFRSVVIVDTADKAVVAVSIGHHAV